MKYLKVLWPFPLVIVLWILSLILITCFVEPEKQGLFGDMFGAVNALFSGLAFAGLIITVSLQSQELKLQRQELKDTRKEFVQQNKTLKRQRFETTLFNMLNIHFQLLQSMHYNNTTTKGILVFYQAVEDFKILMNADMIYKDGIFNTYRTKYSTYDNGMAQFFSQYLQSLTAMHQFILDYSTVNKTRKRYFNILKSYISLSEKVFLFYHTLFSSNGSLNNDLRRMEGDLNIITEIPIHNLMHVSHKKFLTDPNR